MRRLTAVLLSLISPAVLAGPFLVSDPWPAGGPQPTACSYKNGTAPTVTAPVKREADGGVTCNFDLAGTPNGSHTLQVWATGGLWGDSAAVPFAFTAARPAAPSGLSVVRGVAASQP